MPSSSSRFDDWNRKLHYYLGMYFLFFLWLFSLTGLMLNHQGWFTNLYERAETTHDVPIELPSSNDTADARARDLMRQLNVTGEIDWPASQPPGRFDFAVSRPSGSAQVSVDVNARRASVRRFENTALHTFQILHTFSGSRYTQPDSRRDWIITTVWVWAMDALAAGLLVMVLGAYYMWYRLRRRRMLGVCVIVAGVACCSVFVTRLIP